MRARTLVALIVVAAVAGVWLGARIFAAIS
jgi:hypothetical protein